MNRHISAPLDHERNADGTRRAEATRLNRREFPPFVTPTVREITRDDAGRMSSC